MAWISGNYYLTLTQMQNNADEIIYYFRSQDWTDEAIAAMLGNMQSESTINPGIWENLEPFGGGYGLVQWTPYTNYADWAGENWEKPDYELYRIEYERANGLQWIATTTYPMSFNEFVASTATPETLAQVWLYNYERPSSLNQPQRSTQARYWYNYMGGQPQPGDVPIWLLFKFNDWRRWLGK